MYRVNRRTDGPERVRTYVRRRRTGKQDDPGGGGRARGRSERFLSLSFFFFSGTWWGWTGNGARCVRDRQPVLVPPAAHSVSEYRPSVLVCTRSGACYVNANVYVCVCVRFLLLFFFFPPRVRIKILVLNYIFRMLLYEYSRARVCPSASDDGFPILAAAVCV